MRDKVFFDTNVLIHAIAQNDSRGPWAEALLATGGVVSMQILNEFISVARRKIRMPSNEAPGALAAVRVLCPSPVAITIDTHGAALRTAEKHGYEIYDALVAASALEVECATLDSEDLQDGQIIDHQLTIRNPFT